MVQNKVLPVYNVISAQWFEAIIGFIGFCIAMVEIAGIQVGWYYAKEAIPQSL